MRISPTSIESNNNSNNTKLKNDLIMNKMDNKSNDMTMLGNSNNLGGIDFQAVFSNNNAQFMPKCPLCEKTFANSSNLKHHMNTIHFNEAKWICNECGKVCTSKSNLKVHLRVHLRVKPYYCRWCDYNCMHHSSIRDHLSKCHPDKSHNSCEPGYIFNSTAVPEPELSHFEPNTSMHSSANNLDLEDCKLQARKLGNKVINTNSINNNNKRTHLTDMIKEESGDINDFSSQHYSNDDLTNNIKKFKQDYELNKLKKSKKALAKNNKLRGFKEKTFNMNQQMSFESQNLDDSFLQNNETYDQTNYYSDDENNTSIDETLNDNNNLHNNKNSSPSASISSSLTSDSHISSSSSKNNSLQNLQFLSSNISNLTNSTQQNEFFANLLSNLPNLDYQSKQETGPLNNIAAAVLQRLSTVALLQQFSNNEFNKKSQNEESIDESNSQKLGDKSPIDEGSGQKLEDKSSRSKSLSTYALDLSIKAKKQKQCENDTSDEYYSALSPVSTSSTNLSTSSLSSISKLKINEKSNAKLEKSPGDTQHNKKGILDVINRIKSQKSSPQSNEISENTEFIKTEGKSACIDHDMDNNGLDELNDLIKSHLLPISEAVFDKYKSFFDNKKSLEDRDDDEYEEHDDNFHETPLPNSDHEETLKLEANKKKCTFCNIFKNLIDLHELLHKT